MMRVKSAPFLFSIILLAGTGTVFAQDNALVLLRPTGPVGQSCSASSEPQLVTIKDYKISGKKDIRVGAIGGDAVTRNAFNDLKKRSIKDATEIEVRDGAIYAAFGVGGELRVIPDVEPDKNATIAMGQYVEMLVEGQSGSQKHAIPLRAIWRMFILTKTFTMEEALFQHAQEEASIGQWMFYLGKVPSYRIQEAGNSLAQVTTGCIDRAMERFRMGDFAAIDEAKEGAQRLVAMSNDSQASERLAAVRKEEQDVTDTIRTGLQLSRDQRWDEALSTWEPVTKYIKDKTQSQFAEAHANSLAKSHDQHIASAKTAEQGGGNRGIGWVPDSETLTKALKEYEFALTRHSDSEQAQQGRREMLIQLALLESGQHRTAKEPRKSRDLLLRITKEHGEDGRVTTELKAAGCEVGAMSFDHARGLVTTRVVAAPAKPAPAPAKASTAQQKGKQAAPVAPAKPVAETPAVTTYRVRAIQVQTEKDPFVQARQDLIEAVDLCATNEETELLADVNKALADYHVAQATKALLRKPELFATALLNLNAAQAYQAGRTDLEALMTQARQPVQQKAQIQAGVVITSINNECAEAAQQISGTIESGLVGGGSANIQLLARDQAEAMLRQMRSGSAIAGTNQAIVSGQITACTMNVTNQRKQVPSKLWHPNPTYQQLDQAEQQASQYYNQCRGAASEAACVQQKNNRDNLRRRKNSTPQVLYTDYTYEEQPFTAVGQMRLTLQVDDTILRGTRPVGEASGSIDDTCVARRGVRQNDYGQNTTQAASPSAAPARSGFAGFLGGIAQGLATANQPVQIPQNVECPDVPRESRIFQMTEQVSSQAQTQAATAIRDVARNYLELAKRATDQDVALENYITFAILTADKAGPEFEQALAAIRARDADLKPETALR